MEEGKLIKYEGKALEKLSITLGITNKLTGLKNLNDYAEDYFNIGRLRYNLKKMKKLYII